MQAYSSHTCKILKRSLSTTTPVDTRVPFSPSSPFYRQKKGRMKRNGARNGMMMSDPPQVKTDIIMAAI